MKGDYWCNPGAERRPAADFLGQRLELLGDPYVEAMMVHGPPEIIDTTGAPGNVTFPSLNLPARMEGSRTLAVRPQHKHH